MISSPSCTLGNVGFTKKVSRIKLVEKRPKKDTDGSVLSPFQLA